MVREKNVGTFDRDVRANAGYCYSTTDKLSCRLANQRLSRAVRDMTSLTGRRVIDVGCGDGTYTLELLEASPAFLLGVDAAEAAVECARQKAVHFPNASFQVLDIYELHTLPERFDVAVVRGLLHHLYDPEKAIASIVRVAREVVVIEPNGYNPVLKVLERVSPYHVAHEEKSYYPHRLDAWFARHGGRVTRAAYCGLVPMFCPDFMARVFKRIEPWVERTPVLRHMACAVYVQRIEVEGGHVGGARS